MGGAVTHRDKVVVRFDDLLRLLGMEGDLVDVTVDREAGYVTVVSEDDEPSAHTVAVARGGYTDPRMYGFARNP